MQTQVQTAQVGSSKKQVTKLTFSSRDCGMMNIPGVENAYMASCFIPVTEVPAELDRFMGTNPRVPSRNAKGLLKGPVVAGMLETLREAPEDFVIKNNGIDILAENVQHKDGTITAIFSDLGLHGIVNGSHTFAAIREAIDTSDDVEKQNLKKAYVRINIYEGITAELVAEMAAARNTSKQVDEASLMNLQGEYDVIKRLLRGTYAEHNISYNQGGLGSVYITELLGYFGLFDVGRFNDRKHPQSIYNRASIALQNFREDLSNSPGTVKKRLGLLTDILKIVDTVRISIPEAAKENGFKIGMLNVSGTKAGSKSQRGRVLPFTGLKTDYRIPQSWVFPIVAAFRANVKLDPHGYPVWRMNWEELIKATIVDLVAVILAEHKAESGHTERIGKKEAAYARCYNVVELYLAKKRLL